MYMTYGLFWKILLQATAGVVCWTTDDVIRRSDAADEGNMAALNDVTWRETADDASTETLVGAGVTADTMSCDVDGTESMWVSLLSPKNVHDYIHLKDDFRFVQFSHE